MNSREAADSAIARLQRRRADPTYVWGIPWGFPTLDLKTGGIQHDPVKEMAVLMARPNVGKSALAGKVALNVAMWLRDNEPGKVVRLVLGEMTADAFQQRIAAFRAKVKLKDVRSGYVSDEQYERYVAAQQEIAELPIEYAEGVLNPAQIEAFVKKGGNCAWWMLDHIGQVDGADNPFNPVAGLSGISTAIQQVCHEHAPGLIIAHQNRESAKAQDKRPTMESVAGADKVLRDADLLMGLYREDLYLKLPEHEINDPKNGELIILKSREGERGTIYMVFDPTRTEWIEDRELNRNGGRE